MMRYIMSTMAAVLTLLGGAPLAAAPAPTGGTIAVQPKTSDGDYDASLHVFAEVAAAALAARGFTILDDTGHAAYVAELLLGRDEVGTSKARVPGQRGAAMIGLGVAVPLSTGKSELVPVQRTRLELRIHRRGEKDVLWDGAAVTVREAGTPRGADEAVASDLSQALLRSYPAAPGNVIGVP